MTRAIRAALIAAAGALIALALPGSRRVAEEPACAPSCPGSGVRVGLVFDVGGRGDKSFNDSAWEGLLRARRELGVEIEIIEPSGAEDRESALRLFGARGFDVVIGVGFIFSADVLAVAPAFPETRFGCIDYAPQEDPLPPNAAGLGFREEEGSFLVGAAAGLLTKSGTVSFVGGMDVPLIHKFEAGYRAGVREVCPTCKVQVAYAGATPDAFRDPARGKTIASNHIALGADVLFHASGTTGHGVFEAARGAGKLAIGVDADQYDEMPGVVVTSMVKRSDVAVFEMVREVVGGRFTPGARSLGLGQAGVDWVHDGPHAAQLPDDVKARVEALRGRIVRGEISVPNR